ncbi:hypothetical protein DRQ16_03920 [bacterium]|nr:MAG: hypothetical protein DRQ16_03920 [bacterium]
MFVLREALRGMWRNRVMAFIAFGVIFFSLFLLGLFLLATFNLFGVIRYAQEKVEITAFLEDDLPREKIEEIKKRIEGMEGVERAIFVSKEEALKEFKRDIPKAKELLQALKTNPLPSSFKIKIGEGYKNPEAMKRIAKKISVIEGVEEVKYGEEWIRRLDKVVKFLFLFDVLLGVVISIASIFVVSNTIRLTVIARKESIEIMKLVGATERMIEAPFLLEGMMEGGTGGLFTAFILYLLWRFLSVRILEFYFPANAILFGLTLFGIILGYMGSMVSVKKYLKGGEA